ncbi:MAG: SRPBCC family protein [Actinomycetota bacterium]|nr:SRPBCC family protein [Actinomycetota bacterium]
MKVECTPEQVFAVLADPYSYEQWVVGSSETRDADGIWPQVGSTFHHTQFVPKLGLKDTTSVLECEPPDRILLCVRARPLVVAEVELRLRGNGIGTSVAMTERPVGGIVGPIHNPLFDIGLRIRNAESLRRLKRLAESRTA